MRSGESRIGLTRESRPCGRLSKNRKPCERYTQPYEPWCGVHCSEEEKDFAVLLRRVYREGYNEGVMDRARRASNDEWRIRDELAELRRQLQLTQGGEEI